MRLVPPSYFIHDSGISSSWALQLYEYGVVSCNTIRNPQGFVVNFAVRSTKKKLKGFRLRVETNAVNSYIGVFHHQMIQILEISFFFFFLFFFQLCSQSRMKWWVISPIKHNLSLIKTGPSVSERTKNKAGSRIACINNLNVTRLAAWSPHRTSGKLWFVLREFSLELQGGRGSTNTCTE